MMRSIVSNFAFALLFAVGGLLPSLAFAQNAPVEAPVVDNFCVEVASRAASIRRDITPHQDAFYDAISARMELLFKERDARKAEIEAMQRTWDDASREVPARLLGERTLLDSGTQVVGLVNQLDTAIVARRERVARAMMVYERDVRNLISYQDDDVRRATARFDAGIAEAKALAENACAKGVSSDAVRKDFNVAVRNAKESMLNELDRVRAYDTEFIRVANTEQVFVSEAKTDFRSKVKEITSALRASLAVE